MYLIIQAALHYSEPICSSSSVCDEVIGNISARADLIVDVLDCFLSNSSCALFQEALVQDYANNLGRLGGGGERDRGLPGDKEGK